MLFSYITSHMSLAKFEFKNDKKYKKIFINSSTERFRQIFLKFNFQLGCRKIIVLVVKF